MAALSAMVILEIPQVNIMTKMDLLSPKAKKEIEKYVLRHIEMRSVYNSVFKLHLDVLTFFFFLFRYLDPDMYSMMEDNSVALRSKKFRKLTKAICGLVSYNYKDSASSRGIDKYWYMYNLSTSSRAEQFQNKNVIFKKKLPVCCACLFGLQNLANCF